MKRIKRVLSILLSVILLSATLTATPVYAQEQNSEVKMEQTIQKSLSAAEKQMQRIAALPIASVSSYAELVAAIENKTANIYLLQDIQLEAALQIDYNVSFLADSDGKILFAASDCWHIEITQSNVQIQLNNVILDGGYNSGCELELYGGINANDVTDISLINPVVQNCYSSDHCTIENVVKDSSGTFSVYNGHIKNNESIGAIGSTSSEVIIYNTCVENNGAIFNDTIGIIIESLSTDKPTSGIIFDSVIRNNRAINGGGLFFSYANLQLNSKTIIENNTANHNGGGIYAHNSNIESYAKINNNTGTQNGGGVFLWNSTFIMQDGEIRNNAAGTDNDTTSYGGGIGVSCDSSHDDYIAINDGLIEGNFAANGSAIGHDSNQYSTVRINGGIIRKNGYTINEDGTIIDNICKTGGGIKATWVEITNGTVEQNFCRNNGGGIYTNQFKMYGGIVQDNGYFEDINGQISVQTQKGGGIYVERTATITDGLIYSNKAQNGGGIYIGEYLNLCSPAYIRYNEATQKGGGVYFNTNNSNGNTDMSRIRNNSAPEGAQYYFK